MIRFIYTYLKPVALFLTVLVLFQCCVVYDKKSVTVEEAINVDYKKVKLIKIKTSNGIELVYDSIYYKNDKLYGKLKRVKVKSNQKKIIEYRIFEDHIIHIRLHNKTKSITLSVFMPFIVLGAVLAFFTVLCLATDGDCISIGGT